MQYWIENHQLTNQWIIKIISSKQWSLHKFLKNNKVQEMFRKLILMKINNTKINLIKITLVIIVTFSNHSQDMGK